jgi:GalNAc-alpha-(1->4)-GalNAc-alpha-(1->3)-diNAcBac-PP-undecaprenol alpha-1,4-N-acetyl-D-galactosaminyltransferase
MRLAIVLSSMSQGGAQRVGALLANAWAQRGETVCLITLDGSRENCYALDRRVTRVMLEVTGDSAHSLAAIAANWRRAAALRRALQRFRTDAVLSFCDQTNVLAVLATRGTRMRCVIAERTDPSRHSIGRMWDVLRRLSYPMASALVVQTRALLPWARSVMLGRRRAHAVRNPVRDMSAFVRSDRDAARRVVIAVGRLAPEKALDTLLIAFSRVADAFQNWNLVLVGEGPERGALVGLAHALGIAHRVSFPGWLAEPGEPLSQADLFVMPSRYEGFPNALLEAMACGLAAIATDSVGSSEIITPDVDGILVPTDSVEHLEAAMRALMNDDARRARLARAALSVAQRFSLKTALDEWDAILFPGRATLEVQRA